MQSFENAWNVTLDFFDTTSVLSGISQRELSVTGERERERGGREGEGGERREGRGRREEREEG